MQSRPGLSPRHVPRKPTAHLRTPSRPDSKAALIQAAKQSSTELWALHFADLTAGAPWRQLPDFAPAGAGASGGGGGDGSTDPGTDKSADSLDTAGPHADKVGAGSHSLQPVSGREPPAEQLPYQIDETRFYDAVVEQPAPEKPRSASLGSTPKVRLSAGGGHGRGPP